MRDDDKEASPHAEPVTRTVKRVQLIRPPKSGADLRRVGLVMACVAFLVWLLDIVVQ